MYTISQGLNGGWYGHVVADTPDDALAAAKQLARILDDLRTNHPKPARAIRETRERALTDIGAACLDYCEANPSHVRDEVTKAGHKSRTVRWLRENHYLKLVNGAWVVNRYGELDP